jgi:hypothetical protein
VFDRQPEPDHRFVGHISARLAPRANYRDRRTPLISEVPIEVQVLSPWKGCIGPDRGPCRTYVNLVHLKMVVRPVYSGHLEWEKRCALTVLQS